MTSPFPFPFPAYPRTPYPPLIVNVALTGLLGRRERVPNLPITTQEITDDAERCFRAGASVVHLHARDVDGRPQWRRGAYADLIPQIRRRCPGIVVCVTTSGRDVSEFDCRADVLRLTGDARPDMASLTLGSLNFHDGPSVNSIETIESLSAAMSDRGIRPELEIFDLGMVQLAHRLFERGLVHAPLYVNLMLGFPNSASADARSLVSLIGALPSGTVWSAGGLGAYQLPANALASAMGGHVRTGLEDNPWLDPEGRTPASNVELVERAAGAATGVGRRLASPAEARALIGLEPVLAASAGNSEAMPR